MITVKKIIKPYMWTDYPEPLVLVYSAGHNNKWHKMVKRIWKSEAEDMTLLDAEAMVYFKAQIPGHEIEIVDS